MYYAAIGVAVASLTSRRIVGGVALLALALVPSVLTGAVLSSDADGHGPIALINLLALPLYLRDIVFTGHIEATSAARRCHRRRAAWPRCSTSWSCSPRWACCSCRYREPDA